MRYIDVKLKFKPDKSNPQSDIAFTFHKNILANIEMSASNSGVFVVVALVKNSPTNTDPSSRQHMKVVPHPPATTNTKIE